MKITSTLLATTLLLSITNANASLNGSVDGNTVYDSVLNVTWLSNANLAATNTFGVSGIDANGSMTWSTANKWISAMNTANYLGYSDWRLPTMTGTLGWVFPPFGEINSNLGSPMGDAGYNVNTATSEMAHLFYDELGNNSIFNSSGIVQSVYGLVNTGPFTNFQPNGYWSGTEYNSDMAWNFLFQWGLQIPDSKESRNSIVFADPAVHNNVFALAVRDGQVATVPVPAAAWLLGSGLLGLVGVARRKTA